MSKSLEEIHDEILDYISKKSYYDDNKQFFSIRFFKNNYTLRFICGSFISSIIEENNTLNLDLTLKISEHVEQMENKVIPNMIEAFQQYFKYFTYIMFELKTTEQTIIFEYTNINNELKLAVKYLDTIQKLS